MWDDFKTRNPRCFPGFFFADGTFFCCVEGETLRVRFFVVCVCGEVPHMNIPDSINLQVSSKNFSRCYVC